MPQDKPKAKPKAKPVLQDPEYGKQIAELQAEIDKIKEALGAQLGIVV
jgi:hypothetical protein